MAFKEPATRKIRHKASSDENYSKIVQMKDSLFSKWR